jgi:hypothetical protein
LLTQELQLRGDSRGFHLDIQLNAHPDANQPQILESLVSQGLKPGSPAALTSRLKPGPISEATTSSSSQFKIGALNIFQIERENLFRGHTTVIKLSVPSSELCEYLDHMQCAPDIEVRCVARCNGLLFASLIGAPVAIDNYLQSIQVDFTILASSMKIDRWKSSPDSLSLMREIKQQFDANRVLNPGRFLGGI